MYSDFLVNLTYGDNADSIENCKIARHLSRFSDSVVHRTCVRYRSRPDGIRNIGIWEKNARVSSWISRGSWACGNATTPRVCSCVTKVISQGCAKAARRHALWSRINNRQSRNLLSPAELRNIDERINAEFWRSPSWSITSRGIKNIKLQIFKGNSVLIYMFFIIL